MLHFTPPQATRPHSDPTLAVHVTKYKGEPRDYWGEIVEYGFTSQGKLTILVRLFAPEGENRPWRRFVVELAEVE